MTARPAPNNLPRKPVAFATPLVWQIVQRALDFELAGTAADAAFKKGLSKGARAEPAELREAVEQFDAINRHRCRLSWALEQENAPVTSEHLLFAWAAIRHRQTP